MHSEPQHYEMKRQIHHTPLSLPPGKQLLIPTGCEAGWAPEPV